VVGAGVAVERTTPNPSLAKEGSHFLCELCELSGFAWNLLVLNSANSQTVRL